MIKAIDKWFPGYLQSLLLRPRKVAGTRHLIFCLCDHYEPFRGGTDRSSARQTVADWLSAYPSVMDSFRDADGCLPRHTFFYPQEEYDGAILDELAAFCRRDLGEVEIHLHHRHDTAEGLREKLVGFRDLLHQTHGLLGEEVRVQASGYGAQEGGASSSKSQIRIPTASCTAEPQTLNPEPFIRYAFIHGNWALCNSRPDGDWCGVNEELGILADTGCYADFTFPSAPSPTQPRMVNAIYYAHDIPGRPRSADRGERAEVRVQGSGGRGPDSEVRGLLSGATKASLPRTVNPESSLLLITGPLALNWRRRKWGLLPRVENAEISGVNPPTADRMRLWVDQKIHVKGRPDWVFVKVHTHGCVPANARILLGDAMRQAHDLLQREFNDGVRWQLHYVSAREMYNLVKAAEANLPGPPGLYRDHPVVWKR